MQQRHRKILMYFGREGAGSSIMKLVLSPPPHKKKLGNRNTSRYLHTHVTRHYFQQGRVEAIFAHPQMN